MASLMENLIDVLNTEGSEYEVLLALSQNKTPLIVKGQLDELNKVTDDEQNAVNRIAVLDKKRIEVTKDIANVLNRDYQKLKLTDLIKMLEQRPAEQKKLSQAYDRLQAAVRQLKRVNSQNEELLNNALEMVEFEMNMLQATKTAPETANYNRGAYNVGNTMGVSRGFDTKQ